MKIASFDDHRIGLVEGENVVDITSVVPSAFDAMPGQRVNWLIGQWKVIGQDIETARRSG
ncbi:MAG: FAA hydrolase family protein, partial [Comamonadaceae bacterium]